MRNLIPLLAFWLAFFHPTHHGLRAQALPPIPQDQIDSLFRPWQGDQSPGLVLGIVYRGRLVHQQAYGMAHVARREPLTAQHSFWVASVAKQFTAAAVALLAEGGKISLEDDIRKYLPELPFTGDTVRIRHLVYHTSGLRDGFTLIGMSLKGERHYTDRNVLGYLAGQRRANFRPGERHEYNNGGYVLLGEIVARVSGKSLAAFAEENIFQPLGMAHTHFYGTFAQPIPNLATGYKVRYRKEKARYAPAHFRGHTVGSSGLVTTLEDLVKWDQNFYRNRLGRGSADLVRLLTAPGHLDDGTPLPYAFGLEVSAHRGVRAITHAGADPGYKAEMVRFPERELTLIALCNAGDVYNLTARLLRIGEWLQPDAFRAVPPPAFPTPDSVALAGLAGLYLHAQNGAGLRQVSVQNGRLHAARSPEGYREPFEPLAADAFANRMADETLAFQRDETGAVGALLVQGWADSLHLQKVQPADLSGKLLRPYAGRYYSPELGRHYRLTVRRGKLGLSLYHLFHVPFLPLAGDRFLADLVGNNCLVFEKDARGAITGFTFNREGVAHLSFRKKP
jgi:CubicO group peptidase (beta-lactamase class C family)